MYEWLDELSTSLNRLEGQKYLVLPSAGADEAAIAAVETRCGYALSRSHREFLRRWNGAVLRDSRILSAEELLAWSDEAGSTYESKPASLQVLRTFELSSHVYACDTHQKMDEYPILAYDPETFEASTAQAKFPSFEAMLLHDVYDLLAEDMLYLIEDADADLSEEENEEFEALLEEHTESLRQLIEFRGGDLSDRLHPDWSNWH